MSKIIKPEALQIMDDDYHAMSGLSFSLAKKILTQSIERAMLPFGEPSSAMKLGTAIHTLLLRDKPLSDCFMVLPPDVKSSRNRKYQDAANVALANNKEVLLATEAETALKVVSNIRKNPIAKQLLEHSTHRETALVWHEKVGEGNLQIACKGKVDMISKVGDGDIAVVDIKTTGKFFSPDEYMRRELTPFYAFGNMQTIYAKVVQAMQGKKSKAKVHFVWILAQTTPPFSDVWVMAANDTMLKEGYKKWRAACEIYGEAFLNNFKTKPQEKMIMMEEV